jgi:hypothetical protein
MKSYIAVLMFAFSLCAGFAKAEACSPENVVGDILTKQRNMSGGHFYVTSPRIKDSPAGQVYEIQFSSVFSDGSGEIGSIEVQLTTCKVVKFNVLSSLLLK